MLFNLTKIFYERWLLIRPTQTTQIWWTCSFTTSIWIPVFHFETKFFQMSGISIKFSLSWNYDSTKSNNIIQWTRLVSSVTVSLSLLWLWPLLFRYIRQLMVLLFMTMIEYFETSPFRSIFLERRNWIFWMNSNYTKNLSAK